MEPGETTLNKWVHYPLVAGITALAASLPAYAGVLGVPFKPNVVQAGNQAFYDTIGTWNGQAAATWLGNDGNTWMRRYKVSGAALDAADVSLGGNPWFVGFDRLGNYVSVRNAPDGDDTGVFATIRNRNGGIVVPEFRVNSTLPGRQTVNALAVSPSGRFVISWMEQQGTSVLLFVSSYNANGTPAMSETQYNTAPGSVAGSTDIAIDAAGNFVVGWLTYSQSTSADAWVRRYSINGTALTGPIFVSASTANLQDGLRLSMNAQGQFAACWNSWGVDGDSNSVHFQLFNASAGKVGSEQRANVTTAGTQHQCDVGMMDNGTSLVAWNHNDRVNVPSSIPDVRLRQFNANGTPRGTTETVLAPAAGTAAEWPHVGLDQAGYALIGWQGRNTTTNETDPWVQRFHMDTVPVAALLTSGQTVTGLSGNAASWRYYRVNIPAGTASMTISTGGSGTADPNTYLRLGALPTTSAWDIRPATAGPNETIIVNNPLAGEWYIGIYGQTAYSGLSLSYTRN